MEIWIIVANVESRGDHPPREGASFEGRLDYAQGSIVRISSTPGGPISAGYAKHTANPDEKPKTASWLGLRTSVGSTDETDCSPVQDHKPS